MMTRRPGLIIGGICAAMFFASLWLPGLVLANNPVTGQAESYWGIGLLLLGWIEAMTLSLNGVAWFANPCFALATLLLLVHRWSWATVLFVVACLFALTSFCVQTACINEAGGVVPVTGLGSGFWVWFGGMFVGAVASFNLWRTESALQKWKLAQPTNDLVEV